MSRAGLTVLAGMGAVAPRTLPGWRVCGVPGRPWPWRRVCLVLWPSYLNWSAGSSQTLPLRAHPHFAGRHRAGGALACLPSARNCTR